MSKQTINIGIRANDGKGDSLRVAFTKTNNNFTELYTTVATNSNTSNTYYETNQELAQNAYNKANTASLGDILFDQRTMYSNTYVEVGNDHHGRRAWGLTFGQTTTFANSVFGTSVAFDTANNILVAMTTPNEVTGLPQSTVIKFDPYGSIYWRKSVPASNVNNTLLASYAESVAVDANNNVYLLTNIPDDSSTLVTKFNYLGQNVWNTLVSDSIGSAEITVDDEEFPYYVGEHNLITGLDITGELYFTHFNSINANAVSIVALPNRGGVLVGSVNGLVHKFDTEGVYLWSNKVNSSNNTIISLSYDSSNNWYAATTTNIYKFRANNQLIWEKEITGITPNLSSIKYSGDYVYATGTTSADNNQKGFVNYKMHSANGNLVWANALQIPYVDNENRNGYRNFDVKGDFMIGIGYAPNDVDIATIYQLPVDGTLPGTYFGAQSTTWAEGDPITFTYVTVPEAATTTSTTVGSGNTTVTIAENTNYSYTMNAVVYQNPSPENEEKLTYFTQNWDFGANGTLVIPSSGSNLAIEFSGKGVANVGSITARTGAATWNGNTSFELDVTALINKLTPQDSGGGQQYHLADGAEGQIMYIVPGTGGEQMSEYTSMSFDNARWTNGNGVINESTSVNWWLPFRGNNNTAHAVLTLIFTDGAWNLPHNIFD
jgi:hypothetical protein